MESRFFLYVLKFALFLCRKAKKLFEKYCEPLLHLAGVAVTIIQTEREGQARSLIENLDTPTDAIVVAGGDGTLSDVVTGLMRKYQTNVGNVKKCPIGILPLGQTNRMASSLFHGYDELADVHAMADAVMAVVRGDTKTVDVVEVQPLEVGIALIDGPSCTRSLAIIL